MNGIKKTEYVLNTMFDMNLPFQFKLILHQQTFAVSQFVSGFFLFHVLKSLGNVPFSLQNIGKHNIQLLKHHGR